MRLGSTDPTDRLPPRVLVVDDEPTMGHMVWLILERWGYLVDVVQTGAQALERIRHRPPDLTIIDMELGDMCGRDLARLIQGEHGEAAPIIVGMTARDDPSDDSLAELLRKPFGTVALLELVHRHTRDLSPRPAQDTDAFQAGPAMS